ncbi:MAG TPA: double-strand break repair protein AddB [Bauldia sp.]
MAGAPQQPRVFTIQGGVPFLPTLADALVSGELVSFERGDPLALAAVTILVPTRRAARAFGDVLIDRLGSEAVILPVIRPIGDLDEEDHLLAAAAKSTDERLALPPAIAPLTRRLALTRLALAWASGIRREVLGLAEDEPLRIPASAADAARLAADLERLIDDMRTAGVDLSKIATLVPDDHARYFQLTLEFLRIVSERWPQYLLEAGRADPAARRDSLIRAAAARIAARGSTGPIVAAGSSGSIPATALLLSAIARLPNGAVVLPGLDQHLDEAGWDAIDASEADAGFGHPQRALKQLIRAIGIARQDVKPLGARSTAGDARSRLLSEAIRPAETLDAWAAFHSTPEALAGIALLTARNEQEEATAIALAMRETLETPGATAALVTPDRTLARRVAAELGRWKLTVDDSAGVPLGREPHGIFARLLTEAAASDAEPVKLLALLKHPLAAFGMSPPRCRLAARVLEIALFRGHRVAGGIDGLSAALATARAATATEKHAPATRRRLDERQWTLAAELVVSIVAVLAPLTNIIRANTSVSAAAAAEILTAALAGAATDDTGSAEALWGDVAGNALARFLADLAGNAEASALTLPAGDLPFLLAALLDDATVQRPAGGDPRLHIWGTLEARLQSADLLILGGLDEGVWPVATRTDPWLSRAMRAALGLPSPERRLGLAAHDFFQALAATNVVVTRAEKRGGSPTVASRWLQRLRALIGEEQASELAARGDRLVDLARSLDVATGTVTPIRRPDPRPPLAARPASLSVTEIETLIRDPYAIYARRILRLEPLDPLGRPPDGGLRGTLVHEALGRFIKEWRGPYDASAEARLGAIAAEVLREVEDFPDVHAVWSIRFAAIACWFVGFEAARDKRVAARHAEIDGAMPVLPGVFTLRGRADRVDLMVDRSVAIYDFKTATPQTDRSVFAGLTPQMTLEAAMARAGGFPGIPANALISDLAWLAVGKLGREDPYTTAVKRGENANDLADAAHRHLTELVTKFADPNHPYQSRTRPRMENTRYVSDYDHLARVREWALVESPEDVAMMMGPVAS